jgi:hypothetical protein
MPIIETLFVDLMSTVPFSEEFQIDTLPAPMVIKLDSATVVFCMVTSKDGPAVLHQAPPAARTMSFFRFTPLMSKMTWSALSLLTW